MKASKFTEAQKAFITKQGEEGSRSTSCSAGGMICAKLWHLSPAKTLRQSCNMPKPFTCLSSR